MKFSGSQMDTWVELISLKSVVSFPFVILFKLGNPKTI